MLAQIQIALPILEGRGLIKLILHLLNPTHLDYRQNSHFSIIGITKKVKAGYLFSFQHDY